MKKIAIFAVAAVMAAFANASELWWTVNTSEFQWDTAKLFVTTEGSNFNGTLVESWSKTDMEDFGNAYTKIDDYMGSANAFYIELYKADEWLAASYTYMGSKAMGANSLASLSGAVYSGGMQATGGTPYTFTNFSSNVIPEPTSGLMILIGLAALGLKRKRA